MRIISNFAPIIKIILWILFALSIVAAVLSVLIITEATPLHLLSIGQGYVLLFTSTLSAVISVLLATIHYQITKTHLRLNVAFFDILSGRIRLENILNIVIRDKKMYISYIWQGQDPIIALIAIRPKNFEKMKDGLLKANPNIVFFDDDTKNNEKSNNSADE